MVFPRFLCLSVFLILAGCRAHAPVNGEPVRVTGVDGSSMNGSLFRPESDHAPAMLLLHMLGSDRHAWDLFARAATARGYLVLSIDMPGLDSASFSAGESQQRAAVAIVKNDLAPAIDFLLANGADAENVVIIGASIGANLALRYAANDPRIQALVLLSPGEEYRGVTVLPELEVYGQRPLLLVATEGDSYSAATARKMKESAEDSYCELRMYRGSSHGTDILNTMDVATGEIFLWLEPIVKGSRP